MPQLSIVATLYYSQQYVEEFYHRCLGSLSRLGITDYEFIFVDDGSPDDSITVAKALAVEDSRIKIIELSRNFGHHKAIMTGLSHTSGERVFLIDIDLEEAPELLESFWSQMDQATEESVDVVFGVQQTRKGGYFERVSGSWFYAIFNKLSDEAKLEENCLTLRLMTRRYVDALGRFNYQEFYFAPVCALTGFNQVSQVVDKKHQSPTTYNFTRKYNMLVNAVFYFTTKPLYFIFYLGILITLASFSLGTYFIFTKFYYGIDAPGWASIIISIWFLGGVIILFLGIQAIYISKIFNETKKSPFTIVKNIYQYRAENE